MECRAPDPRSTGLCVMAQLEGQTRWISALSRLLKITDGPMKVQEVWREHRGLLEKESWKNLTPKGQLKEESVRRLRQMRTNVR